MADLPVIVLKEIFDFLSIQERLRLRSTCKAWKFVIETFNSPPSLCIYSNKYPYKERWSFFDRIVTEDEMLYLNRYSNRRLSLKMEFFRTLQSLYLYNIDDKKVNHFLEELNSLPRLKVLMITKGRIHLKRLSLASLEKLSLEYCVVDPIKLDTPNLNSLVYKNVLEKNDVINFRFPLRVKHLQCLSFNSNLIQLKNLETLACKMIAPDFSLNDFKSLRRLEIWPHEDDLPLMRRIHEQRNRLNRNLKLIVSGLVSSSSNEFLATFFKLSSAYLEAIEGNSSKFVRPTVPWQFGIKIETLVEYWDRVLSKFFNGCHLRIELIQHSTVLALLENGLSLSRLIELLRKSQTSTLQIGELEPSFFSDRVDLPAEFYHQIACLESLSHLSIEIRFENFDFDCLLKLKKLQTLVIKSETIPITFICKAVKQFKFFFQIELRLLSHSNPLIISIWFDPGLNASLPYHLEYGYSQFDVKNYKAVDEVIQGLNEMRESFLVSFPSFLPLLV